MNRTCKIKLIKKLEVSDLAGEMVMIDFQSGKYFLLKGSANEIWNFIQSPITIGEIVDKLKVVYDVEEQECLEGTIAFLNQLLNNHFITVE